MTATTPTLCRVGSGDTAPTRRDPWTRLLELHLTGGTCAACPRWRRRPCPALLLARARTTTTT